MPAQETCANCQRLIGALEEACVWKESVVCRECHGRLSSSSPQAASAPPARLQQVLSRHRRFGRSLHIMRFLLAILAAFSFLIGAVILSETESVFGEIEAFILFLISAVLISGAAIVDAIAVVEKKLIESLKNSNK